MIQRLKLLLNLVFASEDRCRGHDRQIALGDRQLFVI